MNDTANQPIDDAEAILAHLTGAGFSAGMERGLIDVYAPDRDRLDAALAGTGWTAGPIEHRDGTIAPAIYVISRAAAGEPEPGSVQWCDADCGHGIPRRSPCIQCRAQAEIDHGDPVAWARDGREPVRPVRVHVAEVEPSRYADEVDRWNTPDGTDAVTKIRMHSRHQGHECTWSVLYVGPDGEARRETGGPVLSGPYAALIPEAAVIARTAVPGDRAATETLAAGDYVAVRGHLFRITDGRMGQNPALELVTR